MTLWNKILVSLKEYSVPVVAQEDEYVSHQHYTQEKWHQDQCTQGPSDPTNGIENTENIKSIHFTVTQEHRAGMKIKDHLCLAFNWYPTKSQFIKTVGRKERETAPSHNVRMHCYCTGHGTSVRIWPFGYRNTDGLDVGIGQN